MRNGSKPCRLRPVGKTAGVRSRSPPGAGRMKRPPKARISAVNLMVGLHQTARCSEFSEDRKIVFAVSMARRTHCLLRHQSIDQTCNDRTIKFPAMG